MTPRAAAIRAQGRQGRGDPEVFDLGKLAAGETGPRSRILQGELLGRANPLNPLAEFDKVHRSWSPDGRRLGDDEDRLDRSWSASHS